LEVTDTRPREVADAEFLRFTAGAAALVAASLPQQVQVAVPSTDANDLNDSGAEQVQESLSWEAIDLTGLLAGDMEPVVPTLFERTDGICLLYPGLVHSFHGESESAKSLLLQAESVRLIGLGHDVLYIDFESDANSVVSRLVQFGADADAIADHFSYVRPEVSPASQTERKAMDRLLSRPYSLVVIDGVTDALGVFGCSSMSNDDITRWIREVPKVIADRTGAAVVVIDHVVKDHTNRNRFAIGGQAKMAALTGAAYTVEIRQPLGVGMRGTVALRVAKDRPGGVRPHCGPFTKRDRTQEAALVTIDSTANPSVMTVEAWGSGGEDESTTPGPFRPTNLMQRISDVVEHSAEPLSKSAAVRQSGGKRQAALQAFDLLVAERYLAAEAGGTRSTHYRSVKPYRERYDERSDHYVEDGNHNASE
jgi:hypothetical protein